ncbi:MAG: ATP-dependent sacrificial sulfur transferase LarE [Clostridiales bacterium]|nr:ATP-dependent sacrificial sulfur transferase LarE [Clostridiales bacterium]
MDELHEKAARLRAELLRLGSTAVAFSGGVDSAYLLHMAHETLGDRTIAVTVRSSAFPRRETEDAGAFCVQAGIRQVWVDLDVLAIPGFSENPPDRCYLCKRQLFRRIQEVAAEQGMASVSEGSNLDDEGDYRPGMRAIAELGVASPLRAAGLTKADIRALSREAGLPTWAKPSLACLASRFAYGEPITRAGLDRVDRAEQLLTELGFSQARVRVHGTIARIELLPEEFPRMLEPETRTEVVQTLRGLGFPYVALDLQGYRTGSMNETL